MNQIRLGWVRMLSVLLLLLCGTGFAQDYSVYVRNHPFHSKMMVVKKAVYFPLIELAKELEIQLNQMEGALWTGEVPPAAGQKEGLYVDGQVYADTLIQNGVTYVKMSTFLPKVGYRFLVNDQTGIIDIFRERKRTAKRPPILKYLSDPVMQHFDNQPALKTYLTGIKDWNIALSRSINDPDSEFDIALNAATSVCSRGHECDTYQDLYTVVEKLVKGFQSESEQMQKLQESFPAQEPPKEFSKSHEALVAIKRFCTNLDTAAARALHISKGLKVTTSANSSTLEWTSVWKEVEVLADLDYQVSDMYHEYLKTFHTELAGLLLQTHYVAPEDNKTLDIQKYLGRLQYARGLEFKTPVQGNRMTPEEEAKNFEKSMSEIKPEQLEQDDAELIDFGFVPKSYSSKKVDFDAQAKHVPAYYDPAVKQFFYRTDISDDFLDMVCYHELEHAVVDQHFDLQNILKQSDRNNNSDLQLAVRSAVEGDAQYSMVFPIAEDFSLDANFLRSVVIPYMLGGGAGTFSNSGGPMIFYEDTVFPYSQGMDFVKQLKNWGGWELVNHVYHDPPQSSHQILHPAAYALFRERPVDFAFPDSPTPAKLVADDVMGEFNTMVLYATHTDGSREDFSGWQGDRYHIFRQGNHDFIVWMSQWATEAGAAKFAKLYQKMQDKLALEGDSTHAQDTYSETQTRDKFAKVMENMEHKSLDEATTGKPKGGVESPYTTLVLQKGKQVEVLQNIPKAEVAPWKSYADAITPIKQAPFIPDAVLWPYQDLPDHWSEVLNPAVQPLVAAVNKSKPKDWKLEGTNLSYFPVAFESVEGNRVFIGKVKTTYGYSNDLSHKALPLFANHVYPAVDFSQGNAYFGVGGNRFIGLQGEGRSPSGKLVHVAIWVSPATNQPPYVIVAETSPESWIKTKPVLLDMMNSLADTFFPPKNEP